MSADVSIIMPVYNAEKYINRSVNSIRSQTYKNWKLIIVDDGSTDGSSDIVDYFSMIDSRIVVWHKPNGGSASARNLALEKVDTKYISFVDADDYVSPYFLELMIFTAKNKSSDIVQCEFRQTNSYDIDNINTVGNCETIDSTEFLMDFCRKKTYLRTAVLWNKIYKSSLFTGVKFPENKGIDDEFVICDVISKATSITKIDSALYYYYLSSDSQMRSPKTIKYIDNVEAIEKQMELFHNIGNEKLCNMLLYRYYSTIFAAYYFLKKYYPDEQELIKRIGKKRHGWEKTISVKETPLSDKLIFLLRILFPNIFNMIHGVLSK